MAVLAAGLLIFAGVSLAGMTRWSIWFDEAFGIYMIRFNFFDIARHTASDVHPPLYYWVLKVWASIFGTSELALRSMSMVAMMGALVFLYLILRRGFGTRAAAGGLAMAAVSPLLIRYAEEARMYGLVAVIVMAATYVFVGLLEKPTTGKWIVYGVLVALGMWTHYFTALMWLAHWAYRAFTVSGLKPSVALRAFFTKDWVKAQVLAVGLFAPWLPFMAKQMRGVQNGGFWIPPVSLATPSNFGADIFLYQYADEVKGWMVVLLLALALGAISLVSMSVPKFTASEKKILSLLCVMAAVPVVLLVLLSMPPLRPAFIDRYLISSVVCIFAFIGVALARNIVSQKFRIPGIVLLGGFMIVSAIGVSHVYAIGNYNVVTKDPLPIRQTLHLAQREAAADEPFVSESVWRFYESHYYQTSRNPVYLQAEDSLQWGSYDMVRKNPYRKIYDVGQFAKQHGGKIWFIGDWKYGQPRLPRTGSWTVVREVHVDGVPDDIMTIRAVELQAR